MITFRESRPVLSELEIVQNPALGAYVLWLFGLGFQAEDDRSPVLPLHFLVLPLLLHRPTLDMVRSTQKGSGLSLFAAKLGEQQQNLLAVHERALTLRSLTLRSLAFAVNTQLVTVSYDDATVRSNSLDARFRKPVVPERIRGFSAAAEKLGYWFCKTGIAQVSSTLRVDF